MIYLSQYWSNRHIRRYGDPGRLSGELNEYMKALKVEELDIDKVEVHWRI